MSNNMATEFNPTSQPINTPFSSSYSNFSIEDTISSITPSIPYNYMPRPNTESSKNYESMPHNIVRPNTTSPDELPAFNGPISYSTYSDENYQKPVNDKILERRSLDLLNPNTSGTNFIPSPTSSSIIG